MWQVLFMIVLSITALFLILLVLIQRGRGGGLAGAFGGMGGQSAFGTKAGDLFTKVTIGVATFWILMCMLSVKVLNSSESKISDQLGADRRSEREAAGKSKAADKPSAPGKSQPAATPKKTDKAEADDPAADKKTDGNKAGDSKSSESGK